MGFMDRWATRAQRKSDERLARWQERQREQTRTGRMTFMDRWAARAQRKSDERLARWQKVERFRRLIPPRGLVEGPDGSIVISVYQSGAGWLRWTDRSDDGGELELLLLVCWLITEVIWWLVFHRTWTVHARTNSYPRVKINVRLPNKAAAYRATAQLVSRCQAEGPAALQSWSADSTAST